MRRRTAVVLLPLFALTTMLAVAPTARAAKNIAFGTFYRGLAPTQQQLFICEASAQGGGLVVRYTQISSCTMTGSSGGFARGITPVIVPGFEAITAGVGAFPPGVYTICISARAWFNDGTVYTESGCETASRLPP